MRHVYVWITVLAPSTGRDAMQHDLETMKTDLRQLRFFDKLTAAEQDWLRHAISTYGEVMDHNMERRWESQTPAEREVSARPLNWPTMSGVERRVWGLEYAADPQSLWAKTERLWMTISCGGLVGGKSALLNRLLRGKAPLRDRPPCNFSYPWYELVEATGPVPAVTVGLGGAMSLGSAITGDGGAPETGGIIAGARCLVINQTAFSIAWANDAATALVGAVLSMFASPDGEREVDDWDKGEGVKKLLPCLTRAHRLWPEVIQAYKAGPEFLVRHGPWPAWKLLMGDRVGAVDKNWALEGIKKGPFSQLAAPNPMDLTFADFDSRLVERPAVEEPAEEDGRLSHAAARIGAFLQGRDPGSLERTGAATLPQLGEQARRSEHEVVWVSSRCWMLEKSLDWVNAAPATINLSGASRQAVEA